LRFGDTLGESLSSIILKDDYMLTMLFSFLCPCPGFSPIDFSKLCDPFSNKSIIWIELFWSFEVFSRMFYLLGASSPPAARLLAPLFARLLPLLRAGVDALEALSDLLSSWRLLKVTTWLGLPNLGLLCAGYLSIEPPMMSSRISRRYDATSVVSYIWLRWLASLVSNVKTKVVPLPCSDTKSMCPPFAWTICFDMNNPRPSLFALLFFMFLESSGFNYW